MPLPNFSFKFTPKALNYTPRSTFFSQFLDSVQDNLFLFLDATRQGQGQGHGVYSLTSSGEGQLRPITLPDDVVPVAIDYDVIDGKFYFFDAKTKVIGRSNTNGTQLQILSRLSKGKRFFV